MLELPLEARGFKWVARKQAFIRKEGFGFSSLLWSCVASRHEDGELEINPFLQVRHDVVDDVVNTLELIYGEENRKYTSTVSRGLGDFPFVDGEEQRPFIRYAFPEEDAEATASNLLSMLDQWGDAFFARYSSLLECSRGLNDPIESTSHPLLNNIEKRAYYGVTTASFVEPQRVSGLVEAYGVFVRQSRPMSFEQIVARLDRVVRAAGLR